MTGRAAVLALGSNLGDRAAILHDAVQRIDALDGVEVQRASSFVDTTALTPHGLDDSRPRYLNGVVIVRTELEPDELLAGLAGVEAELGRVRAERWGDRTVDIDIITMEGVLRDDETLTLPHPRAALRDFVLAPWLEVDPDADLPGHGPVRELLARLAAEEGRA